MIDENCRQTGVARREFLVCSCTAALCLASSPILARRAWGAAGNEYYSANRERFVASFEGTVSSAQGDDLCDIRFKKGRPVRQDWSTEVPKFRSAS